MLVITENPTVSVANDEKSESTVKELKEPESPFKVPLSGKESVSDEHQMHGSSGTEKVQTAAENN